MRIIHHILLSALLLICAISCEREVVSQYEPNEEKMISFSTAEDVWPVITKAAISGIGDLYGDGFRVWGNWTDVADNTDNVNSIFGQGGVVVSATDKDNDSDFEPGVAGSTDSWGYEDKKGWNVGYHSFAAVLPSSANISGTMYSTYSKTIEEGEQKLTYENTLTLDLSSGFDLSANQTDLMCAFQNVDNSDFDASVVELDFRHLFSTIDIGLNITGMPFSAQQIAVTKVELYGIHKSLNGKLQTKHDITYDDENNKTSEALTTNLADCFDNSKISDAYNPYYARQYTAGEGFQYNALSITVVDDLLVFPETFSKDLSLTIVIDLFQQGKTKQISAKISSGEWLPAKSYTYLLPVDPSIFN